MARTGLNSATVRKHRLHLAQRDGRHCAYCRTPFTDLAQATFDHVVPYHLYRTWRREALVLACHACNHRKDNRLSLLLALLLSAQVKSQMPPVPETDVRERPASGAHRAHGQLLTVGVWVWLARAAAAVGPGTRGQKPTPQPHDPAGGQLGIHLCEHHTRTDVSAAGPRGAHNPEHPTAHALTAAVTLPHAHMQPTDRTPYNPSGNWAVGILPAPATAPGNTPRETA